MYNFFLRITDKCNMNCKYCVYHEKDQVDNCEDGYVKKEYIDNVFEYHNRGYSNYMKLDIIGGEPLYDLEKLKNILDYLIVKYLDRVVHINIITNGLNLTNQFVDWLYEKNKTVAKNKFVLSVSFDGIDNDRTTTKNTELIVQNIIYARTKIPVTIYTTIPVHDVDNMASRLISIDELFYGIRHRIFEDHSIWLLSYDDFKKYSDKFTNSWYKYLKHLDAKYNFKKLSFYDLQNYMHLYHRGIEDDSSFTLCSFDIFSDADDVYNRCARFKILQHAGIDSPCDRCAVEYGPYITKKKMEMCKKFVAEVWND